MIEVEFPRLGADLFGIAEQNEFCQTVGKNAVSSFYVACFAPFGKYDASGVGLGAQFKSFKELHDFLFLFTSLVERHVGLCFIVLQN